MQAIADRAGRFRRLERRAARRKSWSVSVRIRNRPLTQSAVTSDRLAVVDAEFGDDFVADLVIVELQHDLAVDAVLKSGDGTCNEVRASREQPDDLALLASLKEGARVCGAFAGRVVDGRLFSGDRRDRRRGGFDGVSSSDLVLAEAIELDGLDNLLEGRDELVEIELLHFEVFALGPGDGLLQRLLVRRGVPRGIAGPSARVVTRGIPASGMSGTRGCPSSSAAGLISSSSERLEREASRLLALGVDEA